MPIRPLEPDRSARNPGRPLAVAHRGDPRAAVENTLEAVRRAADADASAIEVDLPVYGGRCRRPASRRRPHAELEHLGAVAMFCGAAQAMAAVRARDERITLFLSWYSELPPSEGVLEAVRPQYFNPEHRFLSEEAVAHWHARELLVSCWTVDDVERRAELLSWGVDAIISNDVNGVVKSGDGQA